MLLFSKLILIIISFFVFIFRASRICSRGLLISCATIVVFSTRIFSKFGFGESIKMFFCSLKPPFKNILYICPPCPMIDYEGSKSTRENFGILIYQLQPKIKVLVRKLERILIKSCRQHVSLLFNQTYLNEGLLPYCYTHTHTHIYIYIYIHYHAANSIYLSTDLFIDLSRFFHILPSVN